VTPQDREKGRFVVAVDEPFEQILIEQDGRITTGPGHTALYVRTPRLLAELALSRGDGRYVRRLGQLARIGLLVLDDFLLTSPSVIEAKDLLEVIDDRSQVRSTLVVSQLPVEAWHPALAGGDPTLADAILDRLVQHAHRLPLTGASMRRRQPPPEENSVA
jgi:DNA replication protein DnaC